MLRRFASFLLLALILCTVRAGAEEAGVGAPSVSPPDAVERLTEENARLTERVRLLEASCVNRDDLVRRNLVRLKAIARDVKAQRQPMADFEGYVRWMSGSLSSYSKYVEAGSAAASLARFLPIPYAGQAGMFAKFVAHFALSLNATSNAIEKYLKTSQQFVTRVEAIDASKPLTAKEVSELGHFADDPLLKDTADVQAKLATTSDLSASALAFLEGMNQYVGCTDEYWSKTKQLMTRKEADPKEKSYLSESSQSLRAQAASFNTRLKLFGDVATRDAPLIKSLGAFDELIREIDARVVARSR
ncbi:MAG: hypothetical protein HZB55_11160 [Deltaproteobacteria bacterium]|nr:hypothetical protein [Deltaproteobacteria bacterium]